MAGSFGTNREISRERREATPEQCRSPDERRSPGEPGARLFAVVDNARGVAAAVRETDRPAGESDTEAGRLAAGSAGVAPGKPRLNLLGVAALGLWVLAVALGIAAPLLGIAVDFRLVVGVLLASGVVSLLSLPMTAFQSDGKDGRKP